ncbi:hypothetical protein [Neobacillus sp. CF12]|jgi:hypothetical protein|uniref:hypothetical protein n=1 Tax=Neobacillus sp. CF12 TaxID=3055864 RepID=UPI0025A00E16|nr:hypothetical protein [Neobacillus sp. CF12]MDM5329595.1 hypothetical protein [Neobacillus sp. CF12]
MKKAGSNEIQRGQAISFRIPSDTPDHLVKQLQKLKETERRNFSSRIAEFVMEGVSSVNAREREMITVPLPKKLTKAQRDWLKHEHSEALLGSILYQLITDPVRSTSLLASLNSSSIDIDEALYLQEEIVPEIHPFQDTVAAEEIATSVDLSDMDYDDLNEFDWDNAKPLVEDEKVEEEPDLDDLLGGFLASMNK